MSDDNTIILGLEVKNGAATRDIEKSILKSKDTLESIEKLLPRMVRIYSQMAEKTRQWDDQLRKIGTTHAQMIKTLSSGGPQAALANAGTKGNVAQINSQDFARAAREFNAGMKTLTDSVKATMNKTLLEMTRQAQGTPSSNINTLRQQIRATELQVGRDTMALSTRTAGSEEAMALQRNIERTLGYQKQLNAELDRQIAKQKQTNQLQKQQGTLTQQIALKEAEIAAVKGAGGTTLDLARLQLSRQDLITRRAIVQAENQTTAEVQKQIAAKERLRQQVRQLESEQKIANQRQARDNLVNSDAGASLFKVQASLLVNYMVMNQMFRLISFGKQYVIELDKSFRDLQAIIQATDAGMAGLKQTIIDVSQNTRFSAVEVAKAAVIMGQAGLSLDQIGKSIGAVTLLATATGSDLTQAVDVSTSVMSIWNLRAEEMTHISNVLTGALNLSKLTIEKLALGIQYAGNIAADAGATFEETVAALGAISNAGIKSGSTMGTGLRQLLTEFIEPSAKFVKVMNELGLSMQDIDVKSNGLVGVFRNMAAAGFTTSEAFKALDIRAAAAFAAVAKNLDLAELMQQQFILTNAAAEANEVQMKSFANTVDRFANVLGVSITQGLNPMKDALGAVIELLADGLQVLNQYPAIMGSITAAVTVLGGAFIGTRLFRMMSELFKFKEAAAGVSVFASSVRALGAAASVGGGLKGLKDMVALVQLLGAQLAAALGPLGLFTLALAALAGTVALVSNAWETHAEKMDRLKSNLESATGKFSETKERVQSIETAINQLIQRYDNLRSNSGALETAALELQVKFGELGFSFDRSKLSVDTLIESLQALRGEMRGVAKEQAALVASEQALLLMESAKRVRETAEGPGLFSRVANFQGAIRQRWEQNDPFFAQLNNKRQDIAAGMARVGQIQNFSNLTEGEARELASSTEELVQKIDENLVSLNKQIAQAQEALAGGASTGRDGRTDISTEIEILERLKREQLQQKTDLRSYTQQLQAMQISLKTLNESISSSNPAVAAAATYIDGVKKDIVILQTELGKMEDGEFVLSGEERAKKTQQLKELQSLLSKMTVESVVENLPDEIKKLLEDQGAVGKGAREALESALPDIQQAAAGIVVDSENLAEKTYGQLESAYGQLVKRHEELIEAAGKASEEAAGRIRNRINALGYIRQETQDLNRGGLRGRYTDAEVSMMADRQKQLEIAEMREQMSAANARLRAMESAFTARGGDLSMMGGYAKTGTDATQAKQATANKELLQLQDKIIKQRQELTDVTNKYNTAVGMETEAHKGLGEQIIYSIGKYVELKNLQNDLILNIQRITTEVLDAAGDAFSQFFEDVVTGTKSVGESFKSMAASILKTMLNMATKALSSQLLASLFGGLGSLLGGRFGAQIRGMGNPALYGPGFNGGGMIRAATGMAVPTRDSVPILARPGEFIVRNAAVDAIGVENLAAINSFGNRKVQSSASMAAGAAAPSAKDPTVLNVYVVKPDEQPAMGPRDVLATVHGDILRGGETKKLIKQVVVQQ